MKPVAVVGLVALLGGLAYLISRRADASGGDGLAPEEFIGPDGQVYRTDPILPGGGSAGGGSGGSATVHVPIPGGSEGGKFVAPPATSDPVDRTQQTAPPQTAPPAVNGQNQPFNFWNQLATWLGAPPAEDIKSGRSPPDQNPPPAGGGGTPGGGGQGSGGSQRKQEPAGTRQSDGYRAPPPSSYRGKQRRDAERVLSLRPNPEPLRGAGPLIPGQRYVPSGSSVKEGARKGAAHKSAGYATAYSYGRQQARPAANPAASKAAKPKPGKTRDEILAIYAGFRGRPR